MQEQEMNEQKMFYVDTHKTVTSLVGAGLDTKQAEAIVDIFCKVCKKDVVQFATKEDLKKLETKMTHEMKEIGASIRHEMQEFRNETNVSIHRMEVNIHKMETNMHKMEATMKTWFLSFMLAILTMFAAIAVKTIF
jgi:hypothetical protein